MAAVVAGHTYAPAGAWLNWHKEFNVGSNTLSISVVLTFSPPWMSTHTFTHPFLLHVQVHHRLFVCSNAHEQKSNTQGNTTVVNITPGSERLSATGLKVRLDECVGWFGGNSMGW